MFSLTNFDSKNCYKCFKQQIFLAWEDCFPITDNVFSREKLFYPFKNYSFIYRGLFENMEGRILKSVITHGLTWVNKPSNIILGSAGW